MFSGEPVEVTKILVSVATLLQQPLELVQRVATCVT